MTDQIAILDRAGKSLIDPAGNMLVFLSIPPPTPPPPPPPPPPPTESDYLRCVMDAEAVRQSDYAAARAQFTTDTKQYQRRITIADQQYFKSVLACARKFNHLAPAAVDGLADTTNRLKH